jgi:predicted RecB family endonuclease
LEPAQFTTEVAVAVELRQLAGTRQALQGGLAAQEDLFQLQDKRQCFMAVVEAALMQLMRLLGQQEELEVEALAGLEHLAQEVQMEAMGPLTQAAEVEADQPLKVEAD